MPKTGSLFSPPLQTAFTCSICNKVFSSLTRCENHEIRCNAIHYCKTEMHDINEPPNNKELFAMIKILYRENKELKKQLSFVKRGEKIQKQQEIIEWLNENIKHEIDFNTFISRIESNIQNIEQIFTNGYKNATSNLISDKYSSIFNDDFSIFMPLYAFTQKEGMLYIYTDNKWSILQNNDWDKICVSIKQRQLISFEEWKEDNITNIYDERQQSNWLDKMQRLHCLPPYTCNNLNARIKKKIYTSIKCNFSDLLTYISHNNAL